MANKRADAHVVARLAVQISPYTDEFYDELRLRLEEIEKRTDELEVRVQADTRHLAREVREGARAAEAAAGEIRIKAGIDWDEVDTLRKMQRFLTEHGRLLAGWDVAPPRMNEVASKIKIRPDEDFGRSVKGVLDRAFDKTYVGKVDFELAAAGEAGFKKLRREVDREFGKLRNWEYEIDVVPSLADGSVGRALAALRGELHRRLAEDSDLNVKLSVNADLDESEMRSMLVDFRRMKERWEALGTATDLIDVEVAVADGTVDRAIDQVNRELRRRMLGDVEDIKFDVHAGMSEKDLLKVHAKLRELKERWEATEVELKAKLDPDSVKPIERDLHLNVAEGEVERALSRIEREVRARWAGEAPELDVDLIPQMSTHDLMSMQHKLREFKRKWDGTEIEFKSVLDHSSRLSAAARLAVLARDRWVVLKPVVDHKSMVVARETLAALSGFRLAKDLTSNVWDMVKNLDKAVPLTGAVASGLAVAAGAMGVLAMHSLTVGAGLVHIVQSAGLLGPAFAASAGVLVGVFWVAFARLKANMRSFHDDWNKMKDDMASSFWEAARPNWNKGVDEVFPAFRDGMIKASQAGGRHIGQLVESASRIIAPHMDEMFTHVQAGMDTLTSYSDALLKVLDVLGRHGSAVFERMLGWLGRVTEGWAEWLTEAERTGRLAHMIERGITALNDLWRGTRNVYRLFSNLAKVADKVGGADIGGLADGIGRWADIAGSAKFVAGFERTLTAARVTWGNFRTVMSGEVAAFAESVSRMWLQASALMGRTAGRFLKGVLQAFSGSAFRSGFVDFFDGLNAGMERLEPMWPKLASGLGSLLRFMGSMGRGFSPVIGAVLESLARAAERLEPPLSRIVNRIGPRVARMIELGARVLTPLLEAAANLLDLMSRIPGSVEAVVVAFAGWKVLSGVGSLIGALVASLSGLAGSLRAVAAAGGALKAGRGLAAALDVAQLAVKGEQVALVGAAAANAAPKMGFLSGAMTALTAAINPVTLAIGATAVVVGAFAANEAETARRQNERLAASFDALAEGAAGARAEMRSAIDSYSLDGNYMGFIPTNKAQVAANLHLNFSSLNNRIGEWLSWATFDKDMQEVHRAAADMGTWFEKIAQIENPFGAVKVLAELKDKMLDLGVSGEQWNEVVEKNIDDNDELRSKLVEVARAAGLATDTQTLLAIASGRWNVAYMAATRQAEVATRNFKTVNTALDVQYGKLGMTARNALLYADMIEAAGRGALNFSQAAQDASGQALESVDAVLDNLLKQAKAQEQLATNLQTLAQKNVPAAVVQQLAALPNGAAYIEQLADAARDGSAEGQKHFNELMGKISQIAPFVETQTGATRTKIQAMADAMRLPFENFKKLVAESLDDPEIAKKILNAKDIDELVELINTSGVNVSKAIARMGDVVRNSVIEANLSQAGRDLRNAISQSFKAPDGWSHEDEARWRNLGGLVGNYVKDGVKYLPATDSRSIFTSWIDPAIENVKTRAPAANAAGTLVGVGAGRGMSVPLRGAVADAGLQADGYVGAINGRAGDAGQAGGAVGSGARGGLHSGAGPSWNGYGTSLGLGFSTGVRGAAGSAGASGSAVGSGAKSGVTRGTGGSWWSIAWNAVSGFINGLSAFAGSVWNAAWDLGRRAYDAIRGALDINSPSREMAALGAFAGMGFANGVASWADDSALAGRTLAAGVLNSVASQAKQFTNAGVMAGEAFAYGVNETADSLVLGVTGGGVPSGAAWGRAAAGGVESGDPAAMFDANGLRGTVFNLRVSDEREFETYVEGVADGRVGELARMR